MAQADKMQAIYKMRVSVRMLDETYDELGARYNEASPSDGQDIAEEMARVNAEATAEGIFLNHLQAAATEVAPPTPASYQALDQGLAALERMKQKTEKLVRVLQLASAIVATAAGNRTEVSQRTT